jgi:hypothetical protein
MLDPPMVGDLPSRGRELAEASSSARLVHLIEKIKGRERWRAKGEGSMSDLRPLGKRCDESHAG